jgi:hypothetical protein
VAREFDVDRAAISLLIASAVPGVLATLLWSQAHGVTDIVIGFLLWFFFSIPLVYFVGFLTFLLSAQVRFGQYFIPPLVGTASGSLISKALGSGSRHFQFIGIGVCTAVVAALILFWPRRPKVEA